MLGYPNLIRFLRGKHDQVWHTPHTHSKDFRPFLDDICSEDIVTGMSLCTNPDYKSPEQVRIEGMVFGN